MSVTISEVTAIAQAVSAVYQAGKSLYEIIDTAIETAETVYAEAAESGSSKKEAVLAAIAGVYSYLGEKLSSLLTYASSIIDYIVAIKNTVTGWFSSSDDSADDAEQVVA